MRETTVAVGGPGGSRARGTKITLNPLGEVESEQDSEVYGYLRLSRNTVREKDSSLKKASSPAKGHGFPGTTHRQLGF